MKLYRTTIGAVLEEDGEFFEINLASWDELLASPQLPAKILDAKGLKVSRPANDSLLAPVVNQEVWAAGVTYYRSRDARIAESKESGGGSFYDRVYSAERPELFSKSLGPKVIGPFGSVRIRSDAKWSVPEPELALLISSAGTVAGYTIGNDVSSRDIEGENPLYLPQAKVYDGSCAVGPCILISDDPLPDSTSIELGVHRCGTQIFGGVTNLSNLKRSPKELAHYLCRENTFPHGVFLLTGTGIVPHDEFTLMRGDQITITIEGVGFLTNIVA